MRTDLGALQAGAVDLGECSSCGHPRRDVPALGGVNLILCRCVAAYPYAGSLRLGTAYCVAAACQCKPAGRGSAYGALTGRARWVLARSPRLARGGEMTLCGGCYRAVQDVVRAATIDETSAAEEGLR